MWAVLGSVQVVRLPRTTRCCLAVLPVSKTSVLPPGRHPACLWDHWTQGGETVKWCWEFKLIFIKEGGDIDVLRGKKASCLQLHNNVERMVKKCQILIIGGTRKRCVTFFLWFPPIFCQFEIISKCYKITNMIMLSSGIFSSDVLMWGIPKTGPMWNYPGVSKWTTLGNVQCSFKYHEIQSRVFVFSVLLSKSNLYFLFFLCYLYLVLLSGLSYPCKINWELVFLDSLEELACKTFWA